MTKVLGIDPGTHRLGWGVIQGSPQKQTILDCGCIESDASTTSSVYLKKIKSELDQIISKNNPDLLAIETLLFQKNVKTAISVAEARGVMLLAAAEANLNVVEYAPNTIKSTVAGVGNAGKKEVEKMVSLLLGVNTAKLLDDTTDALAVAITGIVTHKGVVNL